jgi:hypothetical protein
MTLTTVASIGSPIFALATILRSAVDSFFTNFPYLDMTAIHIGGNILSYTTLILPLIFATPILAFDFVYCLDLKLAAQSEL